MTLILLLFMCFGNGEVLVLKNGKTIVCKSYEKTGGKVTIVTESNTFSLPERLIDWAASKEKTRQRRASATENRSNQVGSPAVETRKPPKQPIVLTNKEYQKIASPKSSGEAVIPYRKVGNSIIVETMIEGKGPFNMLLDTGASITVISPDTVKRLSLELTGEKVNMVGVAGEVVEASYCSIGEISLGSARVQNMKATVKGIPQLNQSRIIGLLGQDFLNHFVMNLDSAAKTVTLTPHVRSADYSGAEEKRRQAMRDPGAPFRELNSLMRSLQGHYRSYVSGNTTPSREIKDIISRLSSNRDRADDVYNSLSSLSEEQIEPSSRQDVADFLRCYPQYRNLIDEAQTMARKLRSGFSNNDRSSRTRSSIEEARNAMDRARASYKSCLEQ